MGNIDKFEKVISIIKSILSFDIFKALYNLTAFLKYKNDPRNALFKNVDRIDHELDFLKKQRDQILAKEVTSENEEQLAIDFGIITNDIIFLLRKKRDLINRHI